MNTINDPTSARRWRSVPELIDHIVAAHHGYLRLTLPVLDRLVDQIARTKLIPAGWMDRLAREFTALADLLETHLAKQECVLFPRIRQLREPVGETAWACHVGDSLDELMARMTRENHDALARLGQLETCLADRAWAGTGPLADQLIEDMRELHDNFAEHVHLESAVLFPQVRELLQGQGLAV